MSTLQERLKLVMAGPPKITQAALARACGIRAPSVNDWLSGKTKSIEGENLLLAAEFLKVIPMWLASGKGPMRRNAGDSKESNVITADFRAPVRATMIDIPHLDTPGSMGRGIDRKEHEDVIQRLTIDRAYLKSLVSFSLAENLALITGYGDSMKPTFSDGDIMLVDRGVTEVKIDAVYVLAKNDEIFIKRLQRRSDGSFLMISDNKAYEPEAISDMDRFEVLGRVIYVWAGSKL